MFIQFLLINHYCRGSVVLGEYDIDTDPDCDDDICADPIQHFKPEKVFVHPSYNHPQYANDVSLIRLDKKVKLNGKNSITIYVYVCISLSLWLENNTSYRQEAI